MSRLVLFVFALASSACAGSAQTAGPPDGGARTRDAALSDPGDTGIRGDGAGSTDAGASVDAGRAPPARVLFVGNSYTYYHDLPERYAALAGAPTVRMVTAGGRRLRRHATDQELMAVLAEGWDVVILQEQSQILGFAEDHPDRIESIAAARTIAERAANARIVLYLTWGRESGDRSNPELFPDFETMQTRLEAGYAAMQDSLLEGGHHVTIAPVGPAFREVQERDGALFAALYADDGSHPSVLGTSLAALVFARVVSGVATATSTRPSDVEAAAWPTLVAAAEAARAP